MEPQAVVRQHWLNLIETAWSRRSIIWLSGVRRSGKTVLSQTVPGVEYLDCELPTVRRVLQDPESFLGSLASRRIVLDEVQRLANPSELLKIAADHYPKVQILATGSSTLGASSKFKDTLAGRKRDIWLTPMLSADLTCFSNPSLIHRLLHGGLPPFFLADQIPEHDFQEWMDAFWAKDIQELFRLERRHSFQRFVEMLMTHSGSIFEATRFSSPCEVSRTTIANYLAVLEATYVAHVVRPFHKRRVVEIISAPKVYAFDTGFVAYYRGWKELRSEDLGVLWEHYVLNELHGMVTRRINYWRDKRGHEVDFVIVPRSGQPIAIECKWSANGFEPDNVKAFRNQYPEGKTYVVAQDVDISFSRAYTGVQIEFINLNSLVQQLQKYLTTDKLS